jgi:hypothetical protein
MWLLHVVFHWFMWKKQPPNACFNVFLVLLLNPDSVAVLHIWQLLIKLHRIFSSTDAQ